MPTHDEYIKNKEYYKEYSQRAESRVIHNKANKRYRQSKNGRVVANAGNTRYRNSAKGKQAKIRSQSKRERDLGWIKMFNNPFDNSELIDWHHITDVYVVAIPKDLHSQYLGKFHRENTMEIVKQIYLDGE